MYDPLPQTLDFNALAGLRAALEAPESERLNVFHTEVMEPLRPFWAMFRNFGQQPPEEEQQQDTLGIARAFGYYSPELSFTNPQFVHDGVWQAKANTSG